MLPLFAVTREDHRAEVELVHKSNAKRVLCICSGGCTPLNLKFEFPELEVTAFDINPIQLAHAQKKQRAVADGAVDVLYSLNHQGYFERLFRILRKGFVEFLTSPTELEYYFHQAKPQERQAMLQRWRTDPYFMAPFHMAFNDAFLHIMFTEKATQYAGPNSYAAYFQDK